MHNLLSSNTFTVCLWVDSHAAHVAPCFLCTHTITHTHSHTHTHTHTRVLSVRVGLCSLRREIGWVDSDGEYHTPWEEEDQEVGQAFVLPRSRFPSLSLFSRSCALSLSVAVTSSILETDSMSISTRVACVMHTRAAVLSLIQLLLMRAPLQFPSESLTDASRQHPPSAATQRSKNSLRSSQTFSCEKLPPGPQPGSANLVDPVSNRLRRVSVEYL